MYKTRSFLTILDHFCRHGATQPTTNKLCVLFFQSFIVSFRLADRMSEFSTVYTMRNKEETNNFKQVDAIERIAEHARRRHIAFT